MHLQSALSVLLPALMLAGCGASQDSASATPAATDVASPVSTDVPKSKAAAGKSYDCGSGVIVDILGDETLRATIPGQSTVDLKRIANSTPPVFTGANLYFTMGQDGIYLSQENGTELACKAR